ncbi:MAG: hypothetical protein H7Y14_13870, partial [Burkholderiales bacterium]|nr:hypothetical protein [Burkholderiales bacterium]
MQAEASQSPRKVRARDDLVVARAAGLQHLQPLADGAYRAVGAPEEDLEPLDIAGDVPRGKVVMGALGHFARALEIAQRLARLFLDRRRLRRVERREMGTRVLRKLRGRAVEVEGAEDVEHLNMDVVVTARLREPHRTLGQQGDRGVLSPREEDGDADAQRERRVGRIATPLERVDEGFEDLFGGRVAALEVGELRPPRRHVQREAFVAFRRQLRGVELAQRVCVVSLAHGAEGGHQMQVAALRGRAGGRFAQRPARGLLGTAKVSRSRLVPDFPAGHVSILRRKLRLQAETTTNLDRSGQRRAYCMPTGAHTRRALEGSSMKYMFAIAVLLALGASPEVAAVQNPAQRCKNHFILESPCFPQEPPASSWSPARDMSEPRSSHSATLLADGRVLVAGGAAVKSAEIYDPVLGTWTLTGEMVEVRGGHTAVRLPNGKVVFAGGAGPGNASAELFDPATGTWTRAAEMLVPRT